MYSHVVAASAVVCSILAPMQSAWSATLIQDGSLRVWLDASGIQGLDNGDQVETWTDSSSFGNDATQSTLAKRPVYITSGLNGLPALRFDGVNDNSLGDQLVLGDLGAQFTSEATLFVVASVDETLVGDQYNIYTTRNNDSYWAKPANGSQDNRLGTFLESRYNEYPELGVMPYDGDHLFVIEADGSSRYQVWVDGLSPGAVSGNTFAGGDVHQIGGDSGSSSAKYYRGDISEIIIYNRILSDAEFAQVNDYLVEKYFEPIPEPASLALMLAGGGLLLARGRRTRGGDGTRI